MIAQKTMDEYACAWNSRVPPLGHAKFDKILPYLRGKKAWEIPAVQRTKLHDFVPRLGQRGPDARLVEPAATSHVPSVQAWANFGEIRIGHAVRRCVCAHHIPWILIVRT